MSDKAKRALDECCGALASVRTQDHDARRRPEGGDEDFWMDRFGSPYAVDVNKLLCSKAIRRLSRKTQVVVLPRNSHTRDRLSHSFEVANIATTCARILGLNEQLCLAIALGHDIGHTPYGHTGEAYLKTVTGKPFHHAVFGVVVAQKIERKGAGLNLTHQTLQGMLRHSRGSGDLIVGETSPEGAVVMYADKIAYVFADYNDIFARKSIAGPAILPGDFPDLAAAVDWFGKNHRERAFACIAALCIESAEKGAVSFRDSETGKRFSALKDLMYEVYGSVDPKDAEAKLGIVHGFLKKAVPDVDPSLLLALMNDEDVAFLVEEWARGTLDSADADALGIADVVPHLKGRTIDITDPDLGW